MAKREGFRALGQALGGVGSSLLGLSEAQRNREFRERILELQKQKSPLEEELLQTQILKNLAQIGGVSARGGGGRARGGAVVDSAPGTFKPTTSQQKNALALVELEEQTSGRKLDPKQKAQRVSQVLTQLTVNPNITEQVLGIQGITTGLGGAAPAPSPLPLGQPTVQPTAPAPQPQQPTGSSVLERLRQRRQGQ